MNDVVDIEKETKEKQQHLLFHLRHIERKKHHNEQRMIMVLGLIEHRLHIVNTILQFYEIKKK